MAKMAKMAKLRILLADDHAIVRDGLCVLINGQPDMEVVGQAGTGREAVCLAVATLPDVAVLDISMPDMGGAEAAEKIVERCPAVRILVLTRHADQAYLRRLLRAGAAGYVLKKSAAETLIGAIRIVAQGDTYIEPALAGPLLQRSLSYPVAAKKTPVSEVLSAREEEVLQSIAWGRSNKEIAATLSLSIKTVESYKAAAIEKLRLRTRADIVRYAVTRGWLSEDKAPE
jgi:DNA-binding NarL/FixJ family response regulator